jgi:hypothetical protein
MAAEYPWDSTISLKKVTEKDAVVKALPQMAHKPK